jgi:hypothetical protein
MNGTKEYCEHSTRSWCVLIQVLAVEGWGVPKSLEDPHAPYRRLSHAQVFFRPRGFLSQPTEFKQSKAESFQGPAAPRPLKSDHLFSAPRGEVKSLLDRDAGPVGQAHALFRLFAESFFFKAEAARRHRFEKSPRNSGWGGR